MNGHNLQSSPVLGLGCAARYCAWVALGLGLYCRPGLCRTAASAMEVCELREPRLADEAKDSKLSAVQACEVQA